MNRSQTSRGSVSTKKVSSRRERSPGSVAMKSGFRSERGTWRPGDHRRQRGCRPPRRQRRGERGVEVARLVGEHRHHPRVAVIQGELDGDRVGVAVGPPLVTPEPGVVVGAGLKAAVGGVELVHLRRRPRRPTRRDGRRGRSTGRRRSRRCGRTPSSGPRGISPPCAGASPPTGCRRGCWRRSCIRRSSGRARTSGCRRTHAHGGGR